MASAQEDILLSAQFDSMSLDKKEVVVPFTFDMSYKGSEFQQKVCSILGLTSVKGWSIVDTSDDLALVHYSDSEDPYQYGHLRGVLVDTEAGAIVSDSFGYTPSAVYHCLPEIIGDSEKVIGIFDENQILHKFDVDKMSIKRAFEGVVLRCLWHKGKFYQITHKKINSQRSRWGSAKTFIQMYQEAGGPTAEQLFDTTKPFSSTVYSFIVVDTPLLVATKQIVNKPYIVFVESKDFDLKRPVDEVAQGNPISTVSEITSTVDQPFIHAPKELTIKEANEFLQGGYHGFHNHFDIRQCLGESVILCQEIDGKKQAVKINHPSFDWRVRMRGNNPNVVNQFYHLLGSVYSDLDKDSFFRLLSYYIPFPLYDKEALKKIHENYPHTHLSIANTISHENYPTRDDRIQLLWVNYWFSLPYTNQLEALNIFDNFKKDRSAVCKWITNIHKTTPNLDSTDFSPRIKTIIKFCRTSSAEVVRKQNYTKIGQHLSLDKLIQDKIRNLIYKEDGKSLYFLIRTMKQPIVPNA